LNGQRRGRRSRIALAAALSLVLHSLLAALAPAAGASSPQHDAFGRIICISHGVQAPSGQDDPAGHDLLPDCCLAGCMLSVQALAASDDAAVLVPLRRQEKVPAIRAQCEQRVSGREGASGNPRAPPSMI